MPDPDLTRRLQDAQARHRAASGDPDAAAPRHTAATGIALRLGLEMVIALCIAMFIGGMLDAWLGTSPWLLLILTPLGLAAGLLNTVRAAKSMQTHPAPTPAQTQESR